MGKTTVRIVVRRRGLAALLLLWAAAGCALARPGSVQRVTEGPTAEDIFAARFAEGYKRQPTFDESTAFRAEMEQRINDYFARHPDIAASPRASQIRFARRVSVGMSRDEVLVLIGEPVASTRDPRAMREAAGQFWPYIQERAQEMWSYPGSWQLYFDPAQLVDLTYVGQPPQ